MTTPNPSMYMFCGSGFCQSLSVACANRGVGNLENVWLRTRVRACTFSVPALRFIASYLRHISGSSLCDEDGRWKMGNGVTWVDGGALGDHALPIRQRIF